MKIQFNQVGRGSEGSVGLFRMTYLDPSEEFFLGFPAKRDKISGRRKFENPLPLKVSLTLHTAQLFS